MQENKTCTSYFQRTVFSLTFILYAWIIGGQQVLLICWQVNTIWKMQLSHTNSWLWGKPKQVKWKINKQTKGKGIWKQTSCRKWPWRHVRWRCWCTWMSILSFLKEKESLLSECPYVLIFTFPQDQGALGVELLPVLDREKFRSASFPWMLLLGNYTVGFGRLTILYSNCWKLLGAF